MTDDELLRRARRLLSESESPAAFTGAGMSKECGIRTFRGEEGFWREYRAEDLATPGALRKNPRLVWEWYRERLVRYGEVEPHEGYHALVEAERRLGSLPVITQNVDGLHHRAGSSEVVELHGTLRTVSCMEEPGRTYPLEPELLEELPPRCECGAVLRPDVVLFGEPLPVEAISRAIDLADSCDLMLVVGTSMVVFPAASIPYRTLSRGGHVLEINPEATPLSGEPGVLHVSGGAAETLPLLLEGW
ncbi:NAD-dependent protein deacylase [Candidatus Fermentibacteria bacterium]|nr:NAD-dependent protein deacylase [Candidatus Fermentibacteria bacterium]